MNTHKLNLEILQLQGCRFVKIPKGLKSPKTSDWHRYPLTADDINTDTDNVGILLNEHSSGVVAIDFDGASALEYFDKTFGIELPPTVAFTSTRQGRHQQLFKIDSEYFPYLSLRQLKTGTIDGHGKHEQLELRFQYQRAAQSVLPNSTVTDDLGTRTYQYLKDRSPQDVEIATLPDSVLSYWLTLCNDLSDDTPTQQIKLDYTDSMIIHLAETLKQYYPTLSYEEWIRVAWGFKNSIGESDAMAVMQHYYPEQSKNEYKRLMRSRPHGRRCTLGTIRYMITSRGGVVANNDEEILLTRLLNRRA